MHLSSEPPPLPARPRAPVAPAAAPVQPRRVAAAAALALTLAATAPLAAELDRLLTVPSVDLQRYAGTWHEIARLPNRFQAQCASEVTATYTPRDDGAVDVVNRCRTQSGTLDAAEGLARPRDETNTKLTVSFLPAALRWLPFGRGDYWVIALDPAYRWVMVGEPRREFLWVLAREPVMPQDTLESLLGRAREAGFPVERVTLSAQRPTPQPTPAK
jgi:apolipoprotein D and lipocalin family protein